MKWLTKIKDIIQVTDIVLSERQRFLDVQIANEKNMNKALKRKKQKRLDKKNMSREDYCRKYKLNTFTGNPIKQPFAKG